MLWTAFQSHKNRKNQQEGGEKGIVAAAPRRAADGSLQPPQRRWEPAQRSPEAGDRHRDKEVWVDFFSLSAVGDANRGRIYFRAPSTGVNDGLHNLSPLGALLEVMDTEPTEVISEGRS